MTTTSERVDPLPAVCDDLAAESADIFAIIGALSEAQWLLDTPADGWTIRDQISHLAFFDETGTLAATDADAFAASTKALMSGADPMAGPVERGRAMEPFAVRDWFTTVRAQMIDVFRGLSGSTRLPWYGPAMSATSFATARLMETWAHGQDIADALGVIRQPTARLRHVAHIGVRARPFSYATNGRVVPDGEIAVHLRAPDGSVWSWNEQAEANSVTGSAIDFCLMVTQRRHVADTGLVITGPLAEDWVGIAQAFAGGPGTGRSPGQFT